jgi:outer membrane receptor protein involved in Fe transport
MRVPSPVELTCADPSAPCSLPNAFSSDPALKAVRSQTFEIGARGTGNRLHWSAAAFSTELHDDIQFISSGGATSAGFFHNVGETRRQGIELALDKQTGFVTASAQYTYLSATYRTPLILNSPDNSTAAPIACMTCTDISVVPGDRLPGIPLHLVKVALEYAVGNAYSMGATMLAQSSVFARGDENNSDAQGPVPGFAVWGLDASYRVGPTCDVFLRATNIFDHRYSTFGVLGQNVFTGPGQSFDPSGASWRSEQFRSTGIPRGVWLGVTFRFDGLPSSGSKA